MLIRAMIRAVIVSVFLIASLFGSTAPCIASEPEEVTIYHPVTWEDGLHLLPVTQWIPKTSSPEAQVRGAVELLMNLNSNPLGEAQLLRVAVDSQGVTLDFSRELTERNLGAFGEQVTVQAIVQTALGTGHPGPVQLLIEGDRQKTLAGHVSISSPLDPDLTVLWQGYPDLHGHWAERQILAASLGDVVRGQRPMTFAPEALMNRGTFIVTLVAANPPFTQTGHPDEGWIFGDPFEDVNPGTELGRAVRMASAAGYLQASDDAIPTQLTPEQPITRAEAMVMATRSAGGEDRARALAAQAGDREDARMVGYTGAAREMNILRGYPDGSLRLDDPITRAEAVALIVRASDLCPDHGGTALVRPTPGGTLSRGEPVIGVTARKDADRIVYQLHKDNGELLSQGKIEVHERGWFAFCPTLPSAEGPAHLTVDGKRMPLLLEP